MTAVSDNFNRADSGTLGGNWTTQAPANAMQIVSNQVQGTGSQWNSAIYTAASFGLNQCVTATVVTVGGTEVRVAGVLTRALTTEITSYDFWGYSNLARQTAIVKTVAGIDTLLAEDFTTFNNGDIIFGKSIGSIHYLSINGAATRISATDSALVSGSPGIAGYYNNTFVAPEIILDNWTAFDFGPFINFYNFPKPKIRDAVRAGWIS